MSNPARPALKGGAWRACLGVASSGRGRARAAGTASPSSSARRRCRRPLRGRSAARWPSRPGRRPAEALPSRARTEAARPSVCRAQGRAAGAAASADGRAETPAGRAQTPAAAPPSNPPGGNAAHRHDRNAGSSTRADAGAGWARRTRSRSSACTRLSHLPGRLRTPRRRRRFRRHSAGLGGEPVSLQLTFDGRRGLYARARRP